MPERGAGGAFARARRVPLWCWWIFVVWFVSFPWFGWTSTPQWQRASWVPFASRWDKPRDVAANMLLYIPFGWSAGRRMTRWQVALTAAAVATSAEALELFGRTRFPSSTDVVAAAAGALVGVWAARFVR